MEEWIRGLINSATKPIREIAKAAAQRISAVYSGFKDVFARVRGGMSRWVTAGRNWVAAVVNNAAAVLLRLRWLVFTELPRRLGALAASIQAWTRAAVADLARVLRAEASRLRDWLLDHVRDALRALAQVRDALTARINVLMADFVRIRDRVVSVLFDPARLVAWIFEPLIHAFTRYLDANYDRWAEYLWQKRRGIEEKVLLMTERILERIL